MVNEPDYTGWETYDEIIQGMIDTMPQWQIDLVGKMTDDLCRRAEETIEVILSGK